MHTVEVVYVKEPGNVFLKTLAWVEGMTVIDTINASGVLDAFQDIDLNQQAVGIYSKKVALDSELQPGDRVEIYRPLTISPMAKRRRRAGL